MCGAPPKRGSNVIGYIPQQKGFDRDLPIRGVDLVRLGLDGHRWGIGLPSARKRRRVDAAIAAVGATASPTLPSDGSRAANSNGCESPRRCSAIRRLLLCDEPLLSLDLKRQREVVRAHRHANAGQPVSRCYS